MFPDAVPIFLIDPNEVAVAENSGIRVLKRGAGEGVDELIRILKNG